MMTPVARLIVVGSTPKDKLIPAMGWFTMPALIGPLIGPPLAGLVLSVADWPWIFYLNLPIGLLGMIAVMRFVPKGQPREMGRFDTLASCSPPWRSAAWWWWPRPRACRLLPPLGAVRHPAGRPRMAAGSICARPGSRPGRSWIRDSCAIPHLSRQPVGRAVRAAGDRGQPVPDAAAAAGGAGLEPAEGQRGHPGHGSGRADRPAVRRVASSVSASAPRWRCW
jgi:hypothetical protein